MKANDLIKLVTLGYKPADIKELNDLGDDALQIALNGSKLSEVKDYLSLVSGEDGPETDPEPEANGTPESETEPDYKSLYEELKKKSEDQEATIKKIQKENQRKDISGEKIEDEEAQLKEIFSSFM